MIKVKKLAAFLLALVLILSLAGCGNPQKRFIVYGRFQDNYTTDMFDVFCDWETINPLLEKCNFEEYGLYPKFFDPQTGEVHYPGTNGDINTDGFTNGVYHVETLTSGTIIDRYGSNGSGRYFFSGRNPLC